MYSLVSTKAAYLIKYGMGGIFHNWVYKAIFHDLVTVREFFDNPHIFALCYIIRKGVARYTDLTGNLRFAS